MAKHFLRRTEVAENPTPRGHTGRGRSGQFIDCFYVNDPNEGGYSPNWGFKPERRSFGRDEWRTKRLRSLVRGGKGSVEPFLFLWRCWKELSRRIYWELVRWWALWREPAAASVNLIRIEELFPDPGVLSEVKVLLGSFSPWNLGLLCCLWWVRPSRSLLFCISLLSWVRAVKPTCHHFHASAEFSQKLGGKPLLCDFEPAANSQQLKVGLKCCSMWIFGLLFCCWRLFKEQNADLFGPALAGNGGCSPLIKRDDRGYCQQFYP